MSFYPTPFFEAPRPRRPSRRPAPKPKPKTKVVTVKPSLPSMLSKEKSLPFSPVTNKANLGVDDIRRFLNTKDLGSVSYAIHQALESGHGSVVLKGDHLSIKLKVSPTSNISSKLRHALHDRSQRPALSVASLSEALSDATAE